MSHGGGGLVGAPCAVGRRRAWGGGGASYFLGDLAVSAGCFVGSALFFVVIACAGGSGSSSRTTPTSSSLPLRSADNELDGGRPRRPINPARTSWIRRRVRHLLIALLESEDDDDADDAFDPAGEGERRGATGRRILTQSKGDGGVAAAGGPSPPVPPDEEQEEEDHPYIVRRVHDRLSFHEYDETEGSGSNHNVNERDHDEAAGPGDDHRGLVIGIDDATSGEGASPLHHSSLPWNSAAPSGPRTTQHSTRSPRGGGGRPRSDLYGDGARRISPPPPPPPVLGADVGDRRSTADDDDPAGNETDYYPKNANWSHFDLTELLQQQIVQEQQQQQQPQPANERLSANVLAPSVEEEIVEQDDPQLEPRAHDVRPTISPAVAPSSSSGPLSPLRRQASLEGDYGGRRRTVASSELVTEFVWNDAPVKSRIQPTNRAAVNGTGNEPLSSLPPPCTLPTVPSQTELHCPEASPPRTREMSTQPQSSAEAAVTKPARTGFPLVRAESLDDRTVWGSHQHLSRGSSLDRDEEFDTPSVETPTTLSSTRLASRLSSSAFSRTSSAGAASKLSSRPPSSATLSRRSTSVPNLTHLHNSSQHPPPTVPHPSIRDYDRDLTASVRRQNVRARALYNACIMPHSVILIRHGQSMGNTNEELYSTIPDNAMPLTELGWEQARASGRHLRAMLRERNQSPHFIVSPYTRAVETFHGLASAWCDPNEFRHIRDRGQRLAAWYSRLLELGLTWHEDPRIREQDFGNYQNASVIRQAKQDRHRFGAFYYRFPHGESASDVFDRISTFLDSLWRSFDVNKSRVYVLVTHGIAIRVLLARYFRYTISQFSMLANPRNCEMVILRHDGRGKLQLYGRYELEMKQYADEDGGADGTARGGTHVVGVHFHRRLRVLPPEYIRTVPIRISYDDDLSS